MFFVASLAFVLRSQSSKPFVGETVSGNCVLFVDPEVWLFLFLYGWDMLGHEFFFVCSTA